MISPKTAGKSAHSNRMLFSSTAVSGHTIAMFILTEHTAVVLDERQKDLKGFWCELNLPIVAQEEQPFERVCAKGPNSYNCFAGLGISRPSQVF